MGEVIYLPKRYVAAAPDHKIENSVKKLLIKVSGALIGYGVYRLMRSFEAR